MARIDKGVARTGRRPGASIFYPVLIHVADRPEDTVIEIDGQAISGVVSFDFQTVKSGQSLRQKLTLRLADLQNSVLSAQLLDRLHEMTDHNPSFDLDLDFVPVEDF